MNHYSYRSLLLSRTQKFDYLLEGLTILIGAIVIAFLIFSAVCFFSNSPAEEEIYSSPIEMDFVPELGRV